MGTLHSLEQGTMHEARLVLDGLVDHPLDLAMPCLRCLSPHDPK